MNRWRTHNAALEPRQPLIHEAARSPHGDTKSVSTLFGDDMRGGLTSLNVAAIYYTADTYIGTLAYTCTPGAEMGCVRKA